MAVGVLLTGSVATAPGAEAAYRYWSYWRRAPGATGWTYSSSGPSYRVPDGAVEGWRFQPYGSANPSDPPPRSSASFAQICANEPVVEGRKRVGIVVDVGDGGSVGHYCVSIPSSGTGDDALAVRAQELGRPAPRYNNAGLLCSIDGKPPAPECGKQVESPQPAPTSARPAPSRTTAAPTRPTRTTAPPAGDPTTVPPSSGTTTANTSPAATSETAMSAATPSRSASTATSSASSSTTVEPELVLETPSASDEGSGGGLPVPTLVGAGLVAALGAAAAVRMRSRP